MEILSQVGQLFVQSIPSVLFVFLLLVILNQILFGPVIKVLKQREEMTAGALTRAREQTAAAEAKTHEYELAFQSARQEVYRQREASRQAGLKVREAALQRARDQSELWIRDAQTGLTAQVEAAKKELGGATQTLANEIVEAVLSDGPAPGAPGGARL